MKNRSPSLNQAGKKIIIRAILIIFVVFFLNTASFCRQSAAFAAILPNISGIAWIKGDYFIGVHDSKNRGDNTAPRVSLWQLPNQHKTLSWQVLEVNWPEPLGASNDLESITAIPDTNLFLLGESGSKKSYQRLFLLEYTQKTAQIIAYTPWPVPVENVEAIAVTKLQDRYLFLYAERAEGQPSTEIRWTTLTLNPLQFGQFQSVSFRSPFGRGKNLRQVSDMALDSQDNLYITSAEDGGNFGTFRSAIYRIGQILEDNQGKPQVILDKNPKPLAEIDGLKVEGITIQESSTERTIFFTTDDESYGGVFRSLPRI